MKKIIALLLSVMMSANAGVIAFAANGDSDPLGRNCLQGGDFEDIGNFVYGTGEHSDKIVGIENNSIKAIWPKHSHIKKDEKPEIHSGEGSAHIVTPGQYYSIAFETTLQCGSMYNFSAWVKLAPDSTASSANLAITTSGSGWVNEVQTYIAENGEMEDAWEGHNIWGSFNKHWITFSKDEWTKVERTIYVSESETKSEIKAWLGLPSYSKGLNYYIDDVSLEKVDIEGASLITVPKEGTVNFEYTPVGTDSITKQDIVLKEECRGVEINDGILSVTNEANQGIITLCIKKNINGEEKIVAKHNVELHKCTADSLKNVILDGNFEGDGAFKYGSDPKKIIGIEGSSAEAIWSQSYITGYAPESYCGNKALSVATVNPYYPLAFKTKLDRGSLYKFSAYVKLAPNATQSKANLGITSGSGGWSNKSEFWLTDNNDLNSMYKADYIFGDFSNHFAEFSKDEWRRIERTVYVADSENTNPITVWMGLTAFSKGFNYYIDDVTVEKISIDGPEFIRVPQEGSTEYTYTLSNESLFNIQDIVLDNTYEGITYENGVLTVTNKAKNGSVGLCIKKSVQNEEKIIAKKIIDVHNCSSENNLIMGGTFETKGEFKYGTGVYSDKIVGIEGNSVEAIWPQHSSILGYTAKSFCGDGALHIRTDGNYYSTTFKAELERGSVYKFSAWVKLASDSTNVKVNVGATTDTREWSNGNDIFVSDSGNLNNMYTAENIFGTFNQHFMDISKDEWKKIERTIYAADSDVSNTVTAWLGLVSYQKNFEYYIDDVTLEKVSEANLHGNDFIDIPAQGSVTAQYIIDDSVTCDNIVLDKEYAGVTYENGIITVTDEAKSGLITLKAVKNISEKEAIISVKNIALFDSKGIFVETETAEDTDKIAVGVKDSNVIADGAVLYAARYDKQGKLLDIKTIDAGDLKDSKCVIKTVNLDSGMNRIMLWNGLKINKPLCEAVLIEKE